MIKRIRENKILLYLGAVIIGLLILLVVRITYGYLAAEINSAKEDIVITSDIVDEFKLIEGNPLSINATSTTLPEDGNNLVVESKPKVTLKANGTNNKATYNYYVYLDLDSSLIYTSEDNTPEVILTVIDPSGTEINNINGLEYGTTNGVSGFDVTTYSGKLTLASEYTIESTSSTTATEQAWTIRLTYLNLSTDQSANYGNSITTKLTVSKDEVIINTFADHIKSLYTTNGTNNLYLHDSNLAYSAEDGSIRYAGTSDTTNNYVCFGSDAEECPYENLYRIIGVFGDKIKLIKADAANSNILGMDGDYSSATAKNNFPSYNGSFKSFDEYFFNYNGLSDKTINNSWGSNDWETSQLNTINLNKNYINYLNGINLKWAKMIDNTYWNIGGPTWYEKTAKVFYDSEKTKRVTKPSKIGLMNASDYGYSAPSNWWNTNLSHYNNSKCWLDLGLSEWTMSSEDNNLYTIFRLNLTKILYFGYGSDHVMVRPVFYLKSYVEYVSGDGTQDLPYRITY